MSRFDTFVMVDWSGGNGFSDTPRADAIWVCVGRSGGIEPPVYMKNRAVAEAWLSDLMGAELAAGRRVMIGFDFPFGYPAGFGAALTGSDDPFAVWQWFADRIEDAPKSNNRFDVAGQINQRFGGNGPFWANALKRDIEGLPRTKAGYLNPFPERRYAEDAAKGSFTCWQMAGVGSVGSQVMMGLPVLQRLRQAFARQVTVWPFEPLKSPVAFVEIWPSLTVGPAPDGWIKDAWQVHEVVRQVMALPADILHRLLDVPMTVEGSIFGLGHEQELRRAA
jgi:molybdopterin molybdotransferase